MKKKIQSYSAYVNDDGDLTIMVKQKGQWLTAATLEECVAMNHPVYETDIEELALEVLNDLDYVFSN